MKLDRLAALADRAPWRAYVVLLLGVVGFAACSVWMR